MNLIEALRQLRDNRQTLRDILAIGQMDDGSPLPLIHSANDLLDMRCQDAWRPHGERIMREWRRVGAVFVPDEAGYQRGVLMGLWRGRLYAFVYRHERDPKRGTPPNWHGVGLVRLFC